MNENPRAMKMLRSIKNQYINWTVLFNNPSAIDMIEEYVKDKNVMTSYNKRLIKEQFRHILIPTL